MLRNILFQLLALISNIVTQPWRQARFHTVWDVCETTQRPQARGAAALMPHRAGRGRIGNFAVITAIVVCDGLETGYKSNRFVDLPHVLLRHTFPVHSDFRKSSFDLTKIGRRQLNVGCS